MIAIRQKEAKGGIQQWLHKNAVGYAFLLPFLILFAICYL